MVVNGSQPGDRRSGVERAHLQPGLNTAHGLL